MSGRNGHAGTTHGVSRSTPPASSSPVATSAGTTSPCSGWIARPAVSPSPAITSPSAIRHASSSSRGRNGNEAEAVQGSPCPRRESAMTIAVQTPWIQAGVPAIVLAPMEGVADAPMRALLSELGGFTFCVAEYLRVSQAVPGKPVFQKHVPELLQGGRTATGLPVQVQLLGGNPDLLAQAALVFIRA